MKIFLNLIQKNSVTSTIILLACSFTLSLACSSSGGGSTASPAPTEPEPIPEGLFLRPADDADAKVYSNGKGLLSAGISTETLLGTFDHDYLEIDDDPSDDISVGYSYSLAEDLSPPEDNPDLEYSNNLFAINNNQLSFTGTTDSMPSMPPYTLKIDLALSVAINLPNGSYYNLETDGWTTADDGNINDDLFSLNGGEFSDTNDVAEVGATASVDFGGLVLTAKSSTAADNGYRILIAQSASVGDSNIAITLNGNLNLIIIQYGKDVNFDDLKGALDTDGDGVSDGDLAGLFDVTTDGTPTYDGTAKLSASAIDTSFVLAGGGASTKASIELGDGAVTIEAKGSGTGYDGIEIIGRYNNDLAAGEVRIDSVDATGTGKITIHYGKDATLAELIQAFITHYTTDYSGSTLGQLISQPASSSSTTLLGDIFGVYTGIITEDATIPSFRTIDVASGRIYVADTTGDGSKSKIILFDAVDDLRIDTTSFVIVDDENNDGTYAVRAVTEAELQALKGKEFYVLGKAEATQVAKIAASLTKGDASNYATFTADEGGTNGNAYRIAWDDGGAANSGVVVTLSSNTILITYESTSKLSDLAAVTLPDAVATLIELKTAGDGDTLLTAIFGADNPTGESLVGGVDEEVKSQTATIGNIDVTLSPAIDGEVVIKIIFSSPSHTDRADASILTENGKTTITVLFDNVTGAGGNAKTSHIINALNTLDGVSASLASGNLNDKATDNFHRTYQMDNADTSTQGSITIPGTGLTITATANDTNWQIFALTDDNVGGSTAISLIIDPNTNVISFVYTLDATLKDLKDAIDALTGTNAVVSATDGTGYDGTILLVDIFGKVASFTPEVAVQTGDALTINPTGLLFTATPKDPAPYQWETLEKLGTEDYIINLAP